MCAISVSSSKHFYSFEIGTIENDDNYNFNTAISKLVSRENKINMESIQKRLPTNIANYNNRNNKSNNDNNNNNHNRNNNSTCLYLVCSTINSYMIIKLLILIT